MICMHRARLAAERLPTVLPTIRSTTRTVPLIPTPQRALAASPILPRFYTTKSPSNKPALIAQLRKETQAPLAKVKEALEASGWDVAAARAAVEAGQAAVASKLSGREAREGGVGVFVEAGGRRCGAVEVNCETDFVARSAEFGEVVEAVRRGVVAEGAATGEGVGVGGVFVGVGVGAWEEAEVVKMGMGKLREKIVVRRGVLGPATEGVVYGGYAHGSGGLEGMGRIAGLVALETAAAGAEAEKLARQIAQQVVGFTPAGLQELEEMDFLFGGGKVGEVVGKVGKVKGFVRVELGDGM
ncbi:Elongation factor Ts, mitochondrial [Phlyctochytrium bullatum]|nr:Elongation factor Ts, mitochondrial [Phlyctochytrium bullatum]